MTYLQYFGLQWLASAVILAGDKKYWADSIRKALKEFPKKHRQEAASQFCRMLKSEKQARRLRV